MRPILLVHGGAGTLPADQMTAARRGAIVDGLRRALGAGQAVLRADGTALDAVEAAVCALEDDPLFNAGRGAVLTRAGRHEMDAAIMDGPTRRLGAVAAICGPRNPVSAARAVMERTNHVLLVGSGAEAFGREAGLPQAAAGYFTTPDRAASLDRVLAAAGPVDDFTRHGTVGAVALDGAGRLAAATSTGGMTAKQPGRVGDTPVAGAGTWSDEDCAVSATGHGESFIRAAAAHEISARLRLAGQSLDEACAAALAAVAGLGGDGGLIALDRHGNHVLACNTAGMYRGLATAYEAPRVAIYRDEPLG